MAAEGLDWANLDAVWISHFHLDHCGGIFPLLFGLKYAPETQSRTKPLTIFARTGFRKLFERINAAGDYRLEKQPFPFSIIEVEPIRRFEILPGITAAIFDTPHTDESAAILVEESDTASIVYSSDTGFDPALATFAKNVGLFLLECSFIRNKPVASHLELSEAMHLVRRAGPKRALLTHFYPEWDEADFDRAVAEFEPQCEILAASDGMRLEI